MTEVFNERTFGVSKMCVKKFLYLFILQNKYKFHFQEEEEK